MKRTVRVAATQMKCDWETSSNITRAEELVREAHGKGAQIILLQELFRTVYFCQVKENNAVELIFGGLTQIYAFRSKMVNISIGRKTPSKGRSSYRSLPI
jgi:predicted amidohydrolase